MDKRKIISAMVGWGWPLILFIAPLLYHDGLFEYAYLPKAIWLETGAMFALVLWLWSLTGQPGEKRIIYLSPLLGPIIIFLLWALLSLAWAINVYEVVERWRVWAMAGVGFFLVTNVHRNRQGENRLLLAMYGAGALVALIGISQYLFGLDIFRQVGPPAATFGNRNMATHLMVLTLPLGAYLFLRSRSRQHDLLFALSLALMTTYMLYTGTRAGWLAGTAEMLLFWPMANRLRQQQAWQLTADKKKALILACLLFACLSPMGPNGNMNGMNRLGERLRQSPTGQSSLKIRLAIWLNSMAMIQERPLLGTGLGNFQVYYPLYHQRLTSTPSFSPQIQARKVHNDVIQLAVELGIIGLLLALAVPGKALFLLRTVQPLLDKRQRLLRNTLLISLLGMGINSLVSFPAQRAVPSFYAMTCLALFSNLVLPVKVQKTGPAGVWGGFSVALLVLAITLNQNYHRFQADKFLLAALRHASRQEWSESIDLAKQSLRHYPLHTKPVLIFLGEAQLMQNRAKKARHSFTTLLRSYPYNPNAMASLGGCYAALYQYEEARQLFDKSLAILPESWLVYHNMGNMYLQQRRYDKAQAAFGKAVKLHPQDARPWQQLQTAARLNNDPQTAAKAAEALDKKSLPSPVKGNSRLKN